MLIVPRLQWLGEHYMDPAMWRQKEPLAWEIDLEAASDLPESWKPPPRVPWPTNAPNQEPWRTLQLRSKEEGISSSTDYPSLIAESSIDDKRLGEEAEAR